MKNRDGFARDSRQDGRPEACAAWALLLPDAADGLLSEAEESALDRHLSGCAACSNEFAEAQRGLGWLAMLKDHAPEPPERLLGKILAQTAGNEPMASVHAVAGFHWTYGPEPQAAQRGTQAAQRGTQAGGRLRSWLGLGADQWSGALQPRLAMTGAMAFFSVCLTLNITGFSVSQLRAQGLSRPGLQRSFADAGASAVRSFQGLRFVYRVESRVSELRAQNDAAPERNTVR